jgi:uncharacterized protein (TIGR00730 family)
MIVSIRSSAGCATAPFSRSRAIVIVAELRALCVFCGSNPGRDPVYERVAREMGELLAHRRVRLIYGGGGIGLMGAIAKAAMAAGGEVIGVIPHALRAKELAYHQLTDLHVVDTMHERKQLMADLSDGFVAMPGGFGTFEEFCETLTWAQLGLHNKPCAMLNVAGYYDRMLAMFDHAMNERFVQAHHRQMIIAESDPARLLDAMAAYHGPPTEQWLTRDAT